MTNLEKAVNKKYSLGKCISRNLGDVYFLKKYPNRILKIVMEDWGGEELKEIKQCLDYLKKQNNPAVAKIFDVQYVKVGGRKRLFYVMEKLKPLDKKILNQFYDAVGETGYRKDLSVRWKNFINRTKKLKYQHDDMHQGNVMQNERGTIKLIDLESFTSYYC